VSPYRKNSIALNVEELDEDVDIGAPVKTVIPTQGAVVVASYNMNVGFRMLMTLSYQGKPVPFGAMAVSSSAKSGIVGDEGVLYLSGVQPKESLTVSWSKTQKCTVSFNIPQRHYGQSLIHLKGTCQ
jgi:outer membrane usher protein